MSTVPRAELGQRSRMGSDNGAAIVSRSARVARCTSADNGRSCRRTASRTVVADATSSPSCSRRSCQRGLLPPQIRCQPNPQQSRRSQGWDCCLCSAGSPHQPIDLVTGVMRALTSCQQRAQPARGHEHSGSGNGSLRPVPLATEAPGDVGREDADPGRASSRSGGWQPWPRPKQSSSSCG